MSFPDLPQVNHKRDAIYYKFSWSDDEISISETDFRLSLKQYVSKILNETQLDNRPITCQHLPGLDISPDLLSDLVSRSTFDIRCSEPARVCSGFGLDSAENGSHGSRQIPDVRGFSSDYQDNRYMESHTSASCCSVNCLSNIIRREAGDIQTDVLTSIKLCKPDTAIQTVSNARSAELVNINNSQEDFYFDDELEQLPVLQPSLSSPALSDRLQNKTAAGISRKRLFLETGILLDTTIEETGKSDEDGLSQYLPHPEEALTATSPAMVMMLRSWARSPEEWRGHCLKIFVTIVTVVTGLGTLSSIAYLLIRYLILA